MIRIMTRESVIDHENSESGIKPNILEDLKTPSKPESNDLQTKFEKPRKPVNEPNDNIDEHKEQSNGWVEYTINYVLHTFFYVGNFKKNRFLYFVWMRSDKKEKSK